MWNAGFFLSIQLARSLWCWKKWSHTTLPLEISFNGMGGILHPWGVYRWDVLYLRNVSVSRMLETRLC